MEHSVNCFKIIFQYNSSFEQLTVVKVNVCFPENRKPLGGEWELKRHLFRLCIVKFLFVLGHQPQTSHKIGINHTFQFNFKHNTSVNRTTILNVTLINTVNHNIFTQLIDIGEFSHAFNSVMSCFQLFQYQQTFTIIFINPSINIDCLHLNTKKTSVVLIQSAEELRVMDGSNKEVDTGLIKRMFQKLEFYFLKEQLLHDTVSHWRCRQKSLVKSGETQ